MGRNRRELSMEELLKKMERPLSRKDRVRQMVQDEVRQLTVADFYGDLFRARCMQRRTGVAQSGGPGDQEQLHRNLSAYIRLVFPEVSTERWTMRKLATAIAERLDEEDLPLQERMECYELCFVLVAQMRERDNKRLHDGVMEQGAPSLTARLREPARAEAEEDGLLSMDELLRRLKEGDDHMPRILQNASIDCFSRVWLDAKGGMDAPVGSACFEHHRFVMMAGCYLEDEFNEDMDWTKFTRRLTVEIIRHAGDLSQVKAMELYELCYEFIWLMADEGAGSDHRSLMQVHQIPDYRDWEQQEEEKIDAVIDAYFSSVDFPETSDS